MFAALTQSVSSNHVKFRTSIAQSSHFLQSALISTPESKVSHRSRFAASQTRDMRMAANNNNNNNNNNDDDFSNFTNDDFESLSQQRSDNDDRARAHDFHDLMNNHLENVQNTPLADKKKTKNPELFTCATTSAPSLGSVLEHFNEKVHILSDDEMNLFEKPGFNALDDQAQEILLPGRGNELTKLSISDQTAIHQALKQVLPAVDAESQFKNAPRDLRNQVILIQAGSSLEEVRSGLRSDYSLPIDNTSWREFIEYLPIDKDQKVTANMALNLWSLFDLIIDNATQAMTNNQYVKKILPVYEWVLAGQEAGVFTEAMVIESKTRILEQVNERFTHAFVKNTNGNLSQVGQQLLANHGVQTMERKMLAKLFAASPANADFNTNEFTGSIQLSQWYQDNSPKMLKLCDRDQPISLVNPNDQRWQAIGVSTKDLPLVKLNPNVSQQELKGFIQSLGGTIVEAFGMTKTMKNFGTEESRTLGGDERVYSLADLRKYVVTSFIMRLFIQPKVGHSREFHNKVATSGLPLQMEKLTQNNMKNAIRDSLIDLFKETKEPMVLFSVPKLGQFIEKAVELGVKTDAISSYSPNSHNGFKNRVERLFDEHLRSIDAPFDE